MTDHLIKLRVPDVIEAVAGLLRCDASELALSARRLREAGHFARATRSPASWHVTTRHVANLILMWMSGAPAAHAEAVIEIAGSLAVFKPDALRGDVFADIDPVFADPTHSFADGLAALVACTVFAPESLPWNPMSCAISAVFDFERRIADIGLASLPRRTALPMGTRRHDGLIRYAAIHNEDLETGGRGFGREAWIDTSFLFELGQILGKQGIE